MGELTIDFRKRVDRDLATMNKFRLTAAEQITAMYALLGRQAERLDQLEKVAASLENHLAQHPLHRHE